MYSGTEQLERSSGFGRWNTGRPAVEQPHIEWLSEDYATSAPKDTRETTPSSEEEDTSSDVEFQDSGEEDTGDPPRRRRTTPEQLAVLLSVFAVTSFPSTEMRRAVAEQIGLSPRQVQVWFQNQRQKARRKAPKDARHFTFVSHSEHPLANDQFLLYPVDTRRGQGHTTSASNSSGAESDEGSESWLAPSGSEMASIMTSAALSFDKDVPISSRANTRPSAPPVSWASASTAQRYDVPPSPSPVPVALGQTSHSAAYHRPLHDGPSPSSGVVARRTTAIPCYALTIGKWRSPPGVLYLHVDNVERRLSWVLEQDGQEFLIKTSFDNVKSAEYHGVYIQPSNSRLSPLGSVTIHLKRPAQFLYRTVSVSQWEGWNCTEAITHRRPHFVGPDSSLSLLVDVLNADCERQFQEQQEPLEEEQGAHPSTSAASVPTQIQHSTQDSNFIIAPRPIYTPHSSPFGEQTHLQLTGPTTRTTDASHSFLLPGFGSDSNGRGPLYSLHTIHDPYIVASSSAATPSGNVSRAGPPSSYGIHGQSYMAMPGPSTRRYGL